YVSSNLSASAPDSLHYGKTAAPYDYDDGTKVIGTATTPLLAIPAQGAELEFSLYKYTEGGTSFDQFQVEILDSASTVLATYPRYGEYRDAAFTRLHAPIPYVSGGARVRFRFD